MRAGKLNQLLNDKHLPKIEEYESSFCLYQVPLLKTIVKSKLNNLYNPSKKWLFSLNLDA